MLAVDNITPEQRKKDGLKTIRSIRRSLWKKQNVLDALNKLPNEFRAGERDYNASNLYNGDSFCQLYADE